MMILIGDNILDWSSYQSSYQQFVGSYGGKEDSSCEGKKY